MDSINRYQSGSHKSYKKSPLRERTIYSDSSTIRKKALEILKGNEKELKPSGSSERRFRFF